MELNTITLGKFVQLADVMYEKGKDSVDRNAMGSGIFRVIDIEANSGESRTFTEIDAGQFANFKGEGDQAKRQSVKQGYEKTLTVARQAEDIGITYEMRKFNKYPEVTNRLTSLGELGPNTMEMDLTHRLTFGTATTLTDRDGRTVTIDCGDDLALFSTVHKLTGSARTYRSRIANNPQVSKGGVEAAERLFVEQRYNNLGEKITIKPDVIWSTDDPNTVNTIREILQATADIESDNSGTVNVIKGKYRHVILPYLATDANGASDSDKRRYWGLSSTKWTDIWMGIWERPHLKTPAALNAGEEFSTDDWNFGVRFGYDIGAVTGKSIVMSDGLGTA